MLSDNGRPEAALREMNRARLLEPGSVAIAVDLAWVEWEAGRATAATAALNQLTQARPDLSAPWEYLALIRLSEGDYPGYVAAFARHARLRGNAEVQARADAQVRALAQGVPTLQAVMMREALDTVDTETGRHHAYAAFLASVAGDRAALIDALSRADARRERWGSAGMTTRVRRRWAADAEVTRLLERRRPEAAEQGETA